MQIPFTITEFMDVFIRYNQAIGPMPVVLAVLALVGLGLSFRGGPHKDRIIAVLLGLLWAWTGIVYHIGFFAALNPPAYVFGALFVLQALVFLWAGVFRGELTFRPRASLRGIVGGALILYGLVVYPLLGYAFGHTYPAMPTFGAPCPTTIFTIGLLFWLAEPWPRYVLFIPIVWSVIGGSAAFALGVTEDYGLVVAGLFAIAIEITETMRRHSGRSSAVPPS
ncbi:hypothetical protein H0Z60_01960 [Ectothiorhodospiraceae bacterium WFHF3C12]|nr:hypothetical protein [Ectothiorhodospiraceae bacterium WFHF3C12]